MNVIYTVLSIMPPLICTHTHTHILRCHCDAWMNDAIRSQLILLPLIVRRKRTHTHTHGYIDVIIAITRRSHSRSRYLPHSCFVWHCCQWALALAHTAHMSIEFLYDCCCCCCECNYDCHGCHSNYNEHVNDSQQYSSQDQGNTDSLVCSLNVFILGNFVHIRYIYHCCGVWWSAAAILFPSADVFWRIFANSLKPTCNQNELIHFSTFFDRHSMVGVAGPTSDRACDVRVPLLGHLMLLLSRRIHEFFMQRL